MRLVLIVVCLAEIEMRNDAMAEYTAAQIIFIGLQSVGFSAQRIQTAALNTNLRRFRECFGLEPAAIVTLFEDLKLVGFRAGIMDLLMTLHWLTTYQTESVMAGKYNLNEKTIRNKIWRCVDAIYSLRNEKVRHVFPSLFY